MITKLYKYIPYRKEFFQNYLLRASNRYALNDPFEVLPTNQYLAEIFQETLASYRTKTVKEVKALLNKRNQHNVNRVYIEHFDTNGIISFTETNDNLLMWSHYADQHKGIVLEFNIKEPIFNGKHDNKSAYIGKVTPVMYRKERISHLGNFLIEPYFHKSDEWIYEKEHRLLLPLSQADETWVNREYFQQNKNNKKYFSKIETKPIRGNDIFLSVTDIPASGHLFKDPDASKEGANKRASSSWLTQSLHF